MPCPTTSRRSPPSGAVSSGCGGGASAGAARKTAPPGRRSTGSSLDGFPNPASLILGQKSGSPSPTQGGSRMPESGTSGSVRGVRSNAHPYRDKRARFWCDMARSVDPDETAAAPAPRANPDLVGHEGAERELRRLDEVGRLPHAILLSGPRGIGKATLAFRLARFLLAKGVERAGLDENGLAIDPESGVFRRVAAGGHADLLTIERAYDARRRRLRGEIVVEDAREITGFFRLTAAEEGWRVVVVDGAEEMNRSAANALLKVLEEPPRQALLLLVSHSPGRLLPTIRSRCRRFPLAALRGEVVMQLLGRRELRPVTP